MTRSGLPRFRCCVCHLHHKCAMKSPASVREFFKTVLQQVCHLKVDVIAEEANAAAYKYYKNQEYQDLYSSSVAVMLRERCNVRSIRDTHLKASFILIILPIPSSREKLHYAILCLAMKNLLTLHFLGSSKIIIFYITRSSLAKLSIFQTARFRIFSIFHVFLLKKKFCSFLKNSCVFILFIP